MSDPAFHQATAPAAEQRRGATCDSCLRGRHVRCKRGLCICSECARGIVKLVAPAAPPKRKNTGAYAAGRKQAHEREGSRSADALGRRAPPGARQPPPHGGRGFQLTVQVWLCPVDASHPVIDGVCLRHPHRVQAEPKRVRLHTKDGLVIPRRPWNPLPLTEEELHVRCSPSHCVIARRAEEVGEVRSG